MKTQIGRTRLTALLLVLLTLGSCESDKSPTTPGKVVTWTKTFGGSGIDYGRSVVGAHNEGYVIAGVTCPVVKNDKDVYLLRVSESGKLLWEKTFGNLGDEYGASVARTSDGGYIIAGASLFPSPHHAYVIKTNANGDLVWEGRYRGPGGSGNGNAIAEIEGDGYILLGSTFVPSLGDQVFLVRIDNLGNVVWQKTYGGESDEAGNGLVIHPDGGCLIVGHAGSWGTGNRDIYALRTDNLGMLLWEKSFGSSDTEFGDAIVAASDGGYLLVGDTYSTSDGNADLYLIKIDEQGKKIWEKTIGVPGEDDISAITSCRNGGYVVAGLSHAITSGTFYFAKLTASGDILWQKAYGDTSEAVALSVTAGRDGGCVVVGSIEPPDSQNEDVFVVKVNDNGEL